MDNLHGFGETNTSELVFLLMSVYSNSSSATTVAAGAVGTSELAADAVTAAEIGDDIINSEHYVAASIDNEHIADNAINSEHYAAGSIDEEHLSATNSPTDNYLLSYDSSSSGFTWVVSPSGGGGGDEAIQAKDFQHTGEL